MTEEERAHLKDTSRPFGIGCLALAFVIGMFVLGSLAENHLGRWLGIPPGLGLILGGILGVALILATSLLERKTRALFKRDLADGRVQILHCEPLDAVYVLAPNESPGYFLDLGQDQMLFVCGDYLADLAFGVPWSELPDEDAPEELEELERQGTFPNRNFILKRAPHSGHVLGIECLGGHFLPSKRLIDAGVLFKFIPSDGTVFAGSLDTLESDLKRLHEEKKAHAE